MSGSALDEVVTALLRVPRVKQRGTHGAAEARRANVLVPSPPPGVCSRHPQETLAIFSRLS